MVDGEHVLPMATSQGHKRVGSTTPGPNTGRDGRLLPAPVVTDEVHQRTMDRIIWPTVKGWRRKAIPTPVSLRGPDDRQAGEI